jgi:L-amino acid N-acyltransferase YncA
MAFVGSQYRNRAEAQVEDLGGEGSSRSGRATERRTTKMCKKSAGAALVRFVGIEELRSPEMAFPQHREADVALRDGSTVHVRPARAGDAPAVRAFYERLSPESTALRFFSSFPNLDSAIAWATEVDYQRRYSLLAIGGQGRVLGHAGWEREPGRPERAEVALAIADTMQGKGLGTILLGQLAEAADQAGVEVFGAEVLPRNYQAVQVIRNSGFPVTTRTVPGVLLGVLLFEMPTSLTPEGRERFERREQTAAVAAVRAFLAPPLGGGAGRLPPTGHGRG